MSQPHTDIAIIGMACIYPGARNMKAFWQNILSKVDAVSDPPESWRANHFFDPKSKANDKIYCKRGGFIEEFAEFNPRDYGIMPNAVDGSDPEHFLALRSACEALADAKYLDRPFNRERTAMILGRGNWMNRGYYTAIQHTLVVDQTLHILKQLHSGISEVELQALKQELKAGLPPFNADTSPGLVPNLVTGRIANRLDLQGPNYTVDAACASSLIALDIGMRELLMRRCDMAIVGGANVSTPVPIFMMFCHLEALSRTGRIRPFDKGADGTLLGEGIGMIVIKRREDAERDGDRIYALCKHVGIASDGRALGLLAPRMEGQVLALRRAYETGGISPETIGMIEAHGTGIPLGDATEMQAMARIFGSRDGIFPSCAIGSVKSMISHTIPAAGMASLIKSVLALYHKILPPTLCDEPNPKLELEKTPFYLNTETRPWVHGQLQPRRAGVNAFGFGGINTHAILEEHTGSDGNKEPSSVLYQWDTEVIIVQGESREGLIRAGEHLLRFVSNKPEAELKDVAYTSNCPLRESAKHRLAIVASSPKDLKKKLVYSLKRLADSECHKIMDRSGIFFFDEPLGREGKLAFLFPGEGSQYANMLSDLCIHCPEVRASFDMADRVFLEYKRKPLPSQVVFPLPHASSEQQAALDRALFSMEYAVQLVAAANYGLKTLLEQLEISPQALVGHSTGELTALLASGLVVEQNKEWLFQQGLNINIQLQSIEKQLPATKLLAVGGTDPSVVAAMATESDGELYVAMDNCPNQVVLCGSESTIEDAFTRLKKKGAICNALPFDRPYHTPWCRPLCDRFAHSNKRLAIQPPQVDIYSNMTADLYPEDPDEIRQIITEQWARPVRFRETIEAMYDAGVRIFVEVGPRGNLTSFVEDTLGRRRYVAVTANSVPRSGISQLNYMVGLLAAHGVPMRLDYLYARRNPEQLPIQEGVKKRIEEVPDGTEKAKGAAGTMKVPLALPWLILDERVRSVSLSGGTPSDTVQAAPKADHSPAKHAATAAERPYCGQVFSERVSQEGMKPAESIVPSSVSVESLAPHMKQSREVSAQDHSRSEVMQEYLQTMERYLGMQQEIMGAYLQKKRTAGTKAHSTDRALPGDSEGQSAKGKPLSQSDTMAPSPGATSLHHGPTSPQGPFGIVVTSMTPGKELTATCQFDLDEHVYLLNHTVGGRPSLVDDTLIGLPVVPLTVSTELMAQAASLLVPDKKLVAMTDVRAHRWIEVREKEPCELLITSRRIEAQGREEVEVMVVAAGAAAGSQRHTAAGPGSSGNHLVIEGRMVFGSKYPPPPEIEDPALRSGEPYRLGSEEIYGEMLFHGPTFQAIESINRMGNRGAEATLVVPPDNQLFRSIKDPEFHTDTVLLDAAGQVVGCWALKPIHSGVTFPTGFKALHIYRPFPRSPEPVRCYVRVNKHDVSNIHADMDLIDSRGQLVAQITGWKDVCYFDWSQQFWRFGLSPCDRSCTRSWSVPIAHLPDSLGLRCCLFSETVSGIGLRAIAHVILNRRERETWRRIPGPERHWREWLFGRWAAKDAVRLLLKDLYQVKACPADIEISGNEHGRPLVSGELVEKLGRRLSLSIAHSGNAAVAVVGDSGKGLRGIGIDMERKDRNHEGLEVSGFTAVERSLLDAVPASERDEWLLRLWCAKEAVGKALGRGIMGSPMNLVVQDVSVETGRVNLRIAGQLAQELREHVDKPFSVQTGCDETLVFATSVLI